MATATNILNARCGVPKRGALCPKTYAFAGSRNPPALMLYVQRAVPANILIVTDVHPV